MDEKSVSPTRQHKPEDNVSQNWQMNISKISKPGGVMKDSVNNSFISGLNKFGSNKQVL